MNLLLDTHALLWWLTGVELSEEAVAAIADPNTLVVVSAASIWEAGIKAALGKLRTPEPLSEAVADEGFEALSITHAHAEVAAGLPPHHRDPFDRMLVAQALVGSLAVVTRDLAFAPYGVSILPC
ncbi:MAG: type II toxin-antitoxin system VapC family toxin [Actinomycetota bacterium]|nr:type II toxin-antitoxin system VapC family toxin [Actinomycetota bacterium]